MLKSAHRDLFRHSVVYAVGEILGRVSSILLLPVYTRYLRPADYGVIALLDLTIAVLAVLLGPGIATAVARNHFDARNETERREVWWTGATLVGVVSSGLIAPLWLLHDPVARLALGTVQDGGFYIALALPTLWASLLARTPETYLKVQKRSGVYVTVGLAKLVLNIVLNISFLVWLRLGIAGILLGNLIATAGATIVLSILFARGVGRYIINWGFVPHFYRFGAPLVVTAFLALILHNGDRYFLRAFLPMDEVGIYSIAYTVAQGVNTLLLAPFSSIWGVVIYEIASRPDAKSVYTQAFVYFSYAIFLLMFGVCLFASELLNVIVAADYLRAAELLPILCLAYVFFSLHEHFKVPALLAKETRAFLPVFTAATVTNILGNVILIPRFGTAGAAWATLASFLVFSAVAVWRYGKIDRYPYPFRKVAVVLFALIASFLLYLEASSLLMLGRGERVAVAAVIWGVWAGLLLRHPYQLLVTERTATTRSTQPVES